MAREVFLVRDGVEVWRGRVSGANSVGATSTREYFHEAWQQALRAGVVTDDDAGRVGFRFGSVIVGEG